jgi:hypothetical protein
MLVCAKTDVAATQQERSEIEKADFKQPLNMP